MPRKKAESPTPESVDDMTDEQVEAALAESEGPDPAQEAAEAENQPEPAPEPEKAEEQAPEATQEAADADPDPDSGDDDGEKSENVPFKRYDYERNRRRDLEKQREEDNARWAKRFDDLMQRVGQPQQAQEPVKDSANEMPGDNDPMGQLKWLKDRFTEFSQQTEEQRQQQEQATAEQEAQRQLLADAGAEFQQAVQADPDVQGAYNALVQSFAREAQAYGLTGYQLQQHMQQTEMQHVAYARQNNIPLDRYIKGIASARGWAPQPAQQQNTEAQAQANTEAQKRSKTLSNSGGSPGVTDSPSAQQLMEMSDKEWDAYMEKHGGTEAVLRSLQAST